MNANRIGTTAFSVIVGVVGLANPNPSNAETVFFDDFSDGSVTNDVPVDRDGNPVVWTPIPGLDSGTFDASSGDYVITTAPDDGSAQVPVVSSHVLSDTSIRARVTSDADTGPLLMARVDPVALTAYTAGIWPPNGNAFIQQNLPGANVLKSEPIDLDPSQEDVLLQFDLFGDELSLFAWRPGEPKPHDPIVMVTDSLFQSGLVGLMVDTPVNDTRSGTFRFVQVADMPIPEPSTLTLVVLGVFGFFAYFRRA